MAGSRREVDNKFLHFCPNCHSKNIVRNGHPHRGKIQFFCNTCHKYFSDDSIKGYPPTNIPFPVIAYLLYFFHKVPEFSNMRKYRRFVNYWLKYLKVCDKEISRQTVHHWIKEFDPLLDRVITFEEARDYCHSRIKRLDKVRPPLESIPYLRALHVLERKFGKPLVVQLIKSDEVFFSELVEVVSKHGVFGWEFLEESYEQRSGSKHPLAAG